MKEENLVSPKTIKNIAFNVRKEIQDQLEGEGKVDSIGTGELNKRIRNLLKQVLGITKISDDLIEEVMFLSESEKSLSQNKKRKIQVVIAKSLYITVM